VELKEQDFLKHEFNMYVCDLMLSRLDYWNSINVKCPSRRLALDAENLGTLRHICEHTPFSPNTVDIVSRDTMFRDTRTKKIINDAECADFGPSRGKFVTGELFDWLQRVPHFVGYYDDIILDFCTTWHNPDSQRCIEVIFEYGILEVVSVLVVTFAKRDKAGTEYIHSSADDAKKFIVDTAYKFCYKAHSLHTHYNIDVYSIFLKVIYPSVALDKIQGFKVASSGERVDVWQEAPFAMTRFGEPPRKKRRKSAKKRPETGYPRVYR
jgi:hypothetical protein